MNLDVSVFLRRDRIQSDDQKCLEEFIHSGLKESRIPARAARRGGRGNSWTERLETRFSSFLQREFVYFYIFL